MSSGPAAANIKRAEQLQSSTKCMKCVAVAADEAQLSVLTLHLTKIRY